MKKLPGFILLLVGLVALVAVGIWLSRPRQLQAEDPGRPPAMLPVTLGEVSLGRVQPRVELTGTVRSLQTASLAFELAGVVDSIEVGEAEAVEKGQIVARLDGRDQQLFLDAAGADLSLAERELEKLLAGSRAETIASLRAQLDVARAEEQLASDEVVRGLSLLLRKIISKQDMERLSAEKSVAVGNRASAEQRLIEAQAGNRAEDIAISRARVEVARIAVARARRELDKTTLHAPWAGTVVRRLLSAGDHVAPGKAVFELVDLVRREIEVEIPGRYAALLGGQPRVLLRLDDYPDLAYEAVLDARIPTADDRSRNFRGLIRLGADLDPAGLLKPGMFVRVALWLEPLTEVLVVPNDALRIADGSTILVRALPASDSGWVAEWVPVRILGMDAGGTAVRSLGPELASGDRVVLTGVDLATPGVQLLPSLRSSRSGPGQAGAPSARDEAGDEVGDGKVRRP